RARAAVPDHSHRPRRQRALEDRELRRGGARGACAAPGAAGGVGVMDDYAVVLNAGSSSLKFSVYRRPGADRWRLEARGQIEGIGVAPKFSVKNGAGEKLASDTLDKAAVHDARSALNTIADWLRAPDGGARVLGGGQTGGRRG